MREVKARICFTKACLGDRKQRADGTSKWPFYLLPRTGDGQVRFEPRWWLAGLRFAAELLGRHQDSVEQVLADARIYCDLSQVGFHQRYLNEHRYIRHECFPEGARIEIRLVVPTGLPDEGLRRLLEKMGQFRGISPYGAKEYGFFVVEEVMPCEDQDCESGGQAP